jgi:hypothetical protein
MLSIISCNLRFLERWLRNARWSLFWKGLHIISIEYHTSNNNNNNKSVIAQHVDHYQLLYHVVIAQHVDHYQLLYHVLS